MPKEIKIETLFQDDKKKYLAIVFFTIQFANKKEWLREYHYRYALQKNHNLSPPYQKAISTAFDNDLKMEYANTYSPIEKCFTSRSNLVDHLNKLVDLNLLEKKNIDGKNHYRLGRDYVDELLFACDCAWFSALPKKVPHGLLSEMRDDLESKYEDELKKYDAFFIRYSV